MADDDALRGEDSIIQEFLAPLASGYPGAFGLRDDCAAIAPPPGCELVVKTDPVVEGVHFLPGTAPEDIGWRALAVNISDLAAKGAKPIGYLMALALPAAPARAWMKRFASGLEEAQRAFGCHLMGGDTDCRPGPLSLSITAFGSVPSGRMVRRGIRTGGRPALRNGDSGRCSSRPGAPQGVRVGATAWPRRTSDGLDDRALPASAAEAGFASASARSCLRCHGPLRWADEGLRAHVRHERRCCRPRGGRSAVE